MRFTLQTLAERVLPKVAPNQVIAARERCTFEAAAEVLLEGIEFEISNDELVNNLQHFLNARSCDRTWRVRVLLTLLEFSPFLAKRRQRFSMLSRHERAAFMREKLVGGEHVWSICARIRPLVYIGAYSSSTATAHVGFTPVSERARFSDSKLYARRTKLRAAP
jgi:hypothetical protein